MTKTKIKTEEITGRRWGKVTVRALGVLRDGTRSFADIVEAMAALSHKESVYKTEGEMGRKKTRGAQKAEEDKIKHNLRMLMSRLVEQGLVVPDSNGGRPEYNLTKYGQKILDSLLARKKTELPMPKYRSSPATRGLVIVFDIPECIRYQRAWLREALKSMGLRMVQLSVWMGNVSLPKNFLEDLECYGLFQYVQIFGVSASGTLEEIGQQKK